MTLLALESGALLFADGAKLELPRGVGAQSEEGGVRLMKWVKAPGQRRPVRRDRVLAVGTSWEDAAKAVEAIQAKG